MVEKEITELKNTLIKFFQKKDVNLYKLVVFGSYAKRLNNEKSDIDLVIVSKDFRGKDIFEKIKLISGIHKELVRKFRRPFDLMYYSDTEWNKGSSILINSAKKEGITIY